MLEKLRTIVNKLGNALLRIAAPLVVTSVLISVVSFRQLWSNDVFHVVVLAAMLLPLVRKQLARIDYEITVSRSQANQK